MKNNKKYCFIYKALILVTLGSLNLEALDNAHFYRATRFFAEPRFEKPGLISFDIEAGGGRTSTGFNKYGQKVNVLNIYGPYNMHQLGVHVPLKDAAHPLDQIIQDLTQLPATGNEGTLSFDGTFSTIELNATYTHNLNHGLFIQAHVPIRKLQLEPLCMTDLTPQEGSFNKNTPEWVAFLNSFEQILSRYTLSQKPLNGTHAGDVSIMLGWALNYQDTRVLDFVDVTLKGGVLVPTGKAKNQHELFSLPYGYNKHWGIPLSADAAIGCYEWLSIGAHLEVLPFFKRSYDLRMKTAMRQSGLIKLAHGCATVDAGTLWISGTYIKADHLCRRLSLLTGYSYAHKNADHIVPADPSIFDSFVVNSDPELQSWRMHTIHIFIEYDFTKENHVCGPRLGFFANIPVSGKRIFKSSLENVSFGLEIAL
ncbi:MAG: hypothetical protein NT124_00075 [Candidatus Dependentiae bacterium]|nr:hypothetical protein [Candidatus Dependentiae bacterium]